ncbi:MAG: aldo/keto reductase [Ignavibacteria bacterium]|jgi:aryl-alcohol dehydrogenase-like predicted oxidoreductase|nr:aldo/keto reductase [Ignavibacteria bacterium]MDH7526918.1 aldo/keto reductase [Ignavibacteria bacterium]
MNYRILGKTNLKVSEIGFGAWAIGGPAMAGDIPIGWGKTDDNESRKAILKAVERGINFFDTADFYGLGHSEELLGEVLHNRWNDIILATKVGHELLPDGRINLNYSKDYILRACENSLRRLRKDVIDVYQLHSAKVEHLEKGECIEAMEILREQGKIRYWGISLNTFNPAPEIKFLAERNLGDTIQIVFNVINQIAMKEVIPLAVKNNYGIIARMPLQFGLLTGKFNENTTFSSDDHRSFRLNKYLLKRSIEALKPYFELVTKYNVDPALFALSFVLNHNEISTVIPGIRTEEQALMNTREKIQINETDLEFLHKLGEKEFRALIDEYAKYA